jgi:hypothetical protein
VRGGVLRASPPHVGGTSENPRGSWGALRQSLRQFEGRSPAGLDHSGGRARGGESISSRARRRSSGLARAGGSHSSPRTNRREIWNSASWRLRRPAEYRNGGLARAPSSASPLGRLGRDVRRAVHDRLGDHAHGDQQLASGLPKKFSVRQPFEPLLVAACLDAGLHGRGRVGRHHRNGVIERSRGTSIGWRGGSTVRQPSRRHRPDVATNLMQTGDEEGTQGGESWLTATSPKIRGARMRRRA